jgi:hypothetical protein
MDQGGLNQVKETDSRMDERVSVSFISNHMQAAFYLIHHAVEGS